MSKLYIFEGAPGSGKTSSAKWLADRLREKTKLFLEGDPQHPADYESVACLSENQLMILDKEVPGISGRAQKKGKRYFIPYGSFYDGNREVYDRLKAFDVYELPVEDYLEVTLDKWREFVYQVRSNEYVYILECCFLQNPFTFLLAKHNCSKEAIFSFLEEIVEVISVLNPVVVYFEQDDLENNLQKIRKERPIEWFDFLTWYYTKQEYGNTRGISGVSGVLHFLEERKQLEKEFLKGTNLHKVMINNTHADWDHIHKYLSLELKI